MRIEELEAMGMRHMRRFLMIGLCGVGAMIVLGCVFGLVIYLIAR